MKSLSVVQLVGSGATGETAEHCILVKDAPPPPCLPPHSDSSSPPSLSTTSFTSKLARNVIENTPTLLKLVPTLETTVLLQPDSKPKRRRKIPNNYSDLQNSTPVHSSNLKISIPPDLHPPPTSNPSQNCHLDSSINQPLNRHIVELPVPPKLSESSEFEPRVTTYRRYARNRSTPCNLVKDSPSTRSISPSPSTLHFNHPLDLNTVQRRQPSTNLSPDNRAPKEPVKKNRLFNLESCPTLYPNSKEFEKPFDYILSLRELGEKYGILKIVPPETWNPPFAIDTQKFHFRTRCQLLHEIEGANRENICYVRALSKFHKQQGTSGFTHFPCIDKRPVDLFRLKKLVEEKGGYDAVCKSKRWAEVGRELGYSGKIMSSLSTSLRSAYLKWLQPFEEFIARNSFTVNSTHDIDNSFASNASVTSSPTNTPATDSVSPPIQTSHYAKTSSPDSSDILPTCELSSHIALESGSSVQPSISAINTKKTESHFTRDYESETCSKVKLESRDSIDPRNSGGSVSVKKRNVSNSLDGDNISMIRAKRTKYFCETNGGDEESLRRRLGKSITSNASRNSTSSGIREVCEVCGESNKPLRECDECDCFYHLTCIKERCRLDSNTDWCCPRCLVGTGEFGFQESSHTYSLGQFQEKAKIFKQKHFQSRINNQNSSNCRVNTIDAADSTAQRAGYTKPFNLSAKSLDDITEDDVEYEFWRLAESLSEAVEVEYGADIHSGIHGSGFPTFEKFPLDKYSRDPWNLNNLPLDKDSLFRYIKSDVSGMTVPWVYVGMCFSCFCWHAEDHNTYSINYQHFGDTKTWYAVPAKSFDKFEKAAYELVPDLMKKQPDLLYQLVTLFAPDKLKKLGVEVYAADQRAGQFIITFPLAYHAGFNHGFNVNEAVNFAPSDWEPYGDLGFQRLREYRRPPCFSHDELLLTAATQDISIKTARWLASAFNRLCIRESSARNSFEARHQDAIANLAKRMVKFVDNDNILKRLQENHEIHNHYRSGKLTRANTNTTDKKLSTDKFNQNAANVSGGDDDEDDNDGKSANIPFDESNLSINCSLEFIMDSSSLGDQEFTCSYCNAFASLSRMHCVKSGKLFCLIHAGVVDCCDEIAKVPEFVKSAFPSSSAKHRIIFHYTDDELGGILARIRETASRPEKWYDDLKKVCHETSKPSLKVLRCLLSQGEKINVQWKLTDDLYHLRMFVEHCNEIVDEATAFTHRKRFNRRKGEKSRKQVNSITVCKSKRDNNDDQEPTTLRSVKSFEELVMRMSRLAFESPEVNAILKRKKALDEYRSRANRLLKSNEKFSKHTISEMIDEGNSFTLDIPELRHLQLRFDPTT